MPHASPCKAGQQGSPPAVHEDGEAALFRSLYGLGHFTGKFRLRVPEPELSDSNAVSAVEGDIERNQTGTIQSVTVTSKGSGAPLPPVLTFSGGLDSGAVAYANLKRGRVVPVIQTDPGYGYLNAPDVQIVKSSAQFGAVTKTALLEARVAPGFTRKLTPFGSLIPHM